MNSTDVIIKIVNEIAKLELDIVKKEHTYIEDVNELLSGMGIDSLEYMMVYMWIGEIYKIDNNEFQKVEMRGDITFNHLINFINNKSSETPTFDEAISIYKGN
jgi:hypothetical protein